jgi:RecA-family ATPase
MADEPLPDLEDYGTEAPDNPPWQYHEDEDGYPRSSFGRACREADERAGRVPKRNGQAHEPPPPSGPEDYGVSSGVEISTAGDQQSAPVTLITPAHWSEEAPPPVDWLADQRIPRGDVTTLHGDGGAGKTDVALQLAFSCARAAPHWLGHPIQAGPAVFISAEEPEREIRRRASLHADRDGYDVHAVEDLHFWFPDDVAETTLGLADKSGRVRPTPLFNALKATIDALSPVLVVVDNVTATFVGNQLDRVMARGYVNLWRRVARGPSRPAVLLLDHPSLSGLTNGTGRSGSMDWRNSVRSALYLRSPDDKVEADRGIRILETVKSNYTAPGNVVRLKWMDGGLQVEAAPSSMHRLAKDAECEETFLRLLDERAAQGRDVSDKPSRSYAPKIFAELEGANGFTKEAFARAMERLFHTRKIALEKVGPPSDRRSRIVRAALVRSTQ